MSSQSGNRPMIIAVKCIKEVLVSG